jgi:DNA replication protein DnaC
LEQEVTQRHEHQLRRYRQPAPFPSDKRLEDFDFSGVPVLPKTRMLELAQGAFLTQHENVLLLGPSGLGKPHPPHYPSGAHVLADRCGHGQ